MRESKLGIAVGKKRIGKTWETKKLINDTLKGNLKNGRKPRKVLIVDVNNEYSEYKPIALNKIKLFVANRYIEVRRVTPFNIDGSRMSLNQVAEALFEVLYNYRNGLLIIEDINRYISDSLPQDVIGAICTNAHQNLDIIIHFQSIGRVTPKLWQNTNWVRMHKNNDSVDRHENKFSDRYELFKLMELMINEQYQKGNIRYFLFADLDNDKIRGNYTMQTFLQAVDRFTSENYNKVVKPFTMQRNSAGKLLYNTTQAMQLARKKLISDYYGNK